MPKNKQLETDCLLLEHAVETATDFLTIDELIADYEKYAKEEETIWKVIADDWKIVGNDLKKILGYYD